jgi:hypothetical protein
MFTKQLSLAVLALISISVGSSMAWSNRAWLAGAAASETKINFDQAFADAAWRTSSPLVNRAKKTDRLPVRKSVLPEPARLAYCEPVAASYADPVLGRIVGRCDV